MHNNVFSEKEFHKEFEMRILADKMYRNSHVFENKWNMFNQIE